MIPETAKRADWPRLVKLAFDALNRRLRTREAAFANFGDYADDAAAATAGVAVGEFYHTSGAVKVRVS